MRYNHVTRRLPSLRAILAHAAAARLGSFTEAARELNVTQGAVSRQIQELELTLGATLFVRAGPKLSLTETGRVFAESSARALNLLHEAVAAAQSGREARYVTLSMLPSVATKWLAPRLGRFITRKPEIDLRVSASRNLVDIESEGIDAAIRYGKGKWPGLTAELLGGETVTPVCAPAYAARLGLSEPAQLARATLLLSDIEEDWAVWFAEAGLPGGGLPRGPRLGDDAANLQAAIDGQGVALGRSRLVADDLASGRLIAPVDIRLTASFSYWFVTPAHAAAAPDLIAVRDWVRAEFAKTD